ncbi:MAG TPA: DNA polymerase III subunit delta [Burkholderiales bacterium]|nr:DNA polymerase III subunit delta [Burkholderiales bacterium]
MRINTEQLQQHLARGIQPLYMVFGDEPLLALEASDRIRAAVRAAGYTEREVLTAESGFRWSELAHAGSAQSLFASQRLLELRIPSGKPGTEGSTALQSYAQRLPADTVTLIELSQVDWRSQKSAWFDALERAGLAVEARVVARRALPQWLAGRLKAQRQEADADTLTFIADRVEGNLMAAYQEVQKLALLFPPGKLGYAQVRDAVLDVARYDVFGLGETMLEGDPLRVARMLDGLKGEGAAPPLALWVLTEEIRAIGTIIAGAATGMPVQPLVSRAVRGFNHQKLMQARYQRYSADDINDALRHAAAIDRMIKGLTKGDVWNELLQLALRFCRMAPKRKRRREAEAT